MELTSRTRRNSFALAAEMALNPPEPGTDLYEGVDLLRALIQVIVNPVPVTNGVQSIC